MTTTVKVHVGGDYVASVIQDDGAEVTVGPNEEKSFYVPHGTVSEFSIKEAPANPKQADEELAE